MINEKYIVELLNDAFYEYNAILNCSLFYLLWFLTRIEGRKELEKYFIRQTLFLDEAWRYLTALYSIMLTSEWARDYLREYCERRAGRQYDEYPREVDEICKGRRGSKTCCNILKLRVVSARDTKSIMRIENKTRAFSNPLFVIKLCSNLMNLALENRSSAWSSFPGVLFTPDVLLRRLEGGSPIVFIDNCWNIQHCDGNILTWEFVWEKEYELNDILDARREGRMMELYWHAVKVLPILEDYAFILKKSGFRGRRYFSSFIDRLLGMRG